MSAQVIGYLGENGVRDVRIPIGHLLDKWQGLRPLLVMVPVGGSDDEAYPVQYTLDGTDLVWHVSDADTAVAGTTKAAVRMVDDDGRVGMDEPFQVIISPNLSAGGEPPLVIKPWVDKLATLVPRAESAAKRAENAAQNWENGTVPNALALGGKAPSHYLPAVQLLDNPDFAIAQAGYGAPHGSVYYAADRWITYVSTQITKTGNGLQITNKPDTTRSYEAIYQHFNAPVHTMSDGATMGVCIDGVVYALQCGVGETKAANAKSGVAITCSITANGERSYAQINVTKGYAVTVNWIVMYPGSYTADTMPPFIPRPYAVELAECQRYYYQTQTDYGNIYSGMLSMPAGSTNGIVGITFPQTMRTAPTVKVYGTTGVEGTITHWASDAIIENMNIQYGNEKAFGLYKTGALIAYNVYAFHYTASADL